MNKVLSMGLGLLLATSTVAQPVGSQDPVPAIRKGVQTFVLKAGGGFRGEVKSLQGDKVLVNVRSGPATYDKTYDMGELTAASAFRVMQAMTSPKSAEGNVKLAQYALENNLPNHARFALATARRLSGNPKLAADMDKQIHAKGAAVAESEFRKALAEGKMVTARNKLNEIKRRYKDVIPAAKQAELKAALDQTLQRYKSDAVSRRARQASQREDKEFHRAIEPLRKRLDRAIAANKKGLLAGSSMSTALSNFKRAGKELERVNKKLPGLKKKYGNTAKYAKDVNYLEEQTKKAYVDALLNTASIQTTRSQFNSALGNVNKILAMDSGNTRALAMRGRIEAAANEGWY